MDDKDRWIFRSEGIGGDEAIEMLVPSPSLPLRSPQEKDRIVEGIKDWGRQEMTDYQVGMFVGWGIGLLSSWVGMYIVHKW